jgi:hypothetical protein
MVARSNRASPASSRTRNLPMGFRVFLCPKDCIFDVSPADPNRYRITRLEDGREVVRVFLDCCYLGDVAIIEKQSGAVLMFRPGAK